MQPKARFESSQRLFPLAEYSGGIFVCVKVELDLLKPCGTPSRCCCECLYVALCRGLEVEGQLCQDP